MNLPKFEDLPSQKKLLLVAGAVIILGLAWLMISGGGAASVIEKQAVVTETYIQDIEAAKSPDDMVPAIERYTDGMKVLLPEIRKFNEAYKRGENLSQATAEEMKRMEKAAARMSSALMKSVRYMTDEKVQKAMEKMGEELSELE